MKKFLAFVALVCAISGLSKETKLLFSRGQFQNHNAKSDVVALTVPFVYSGSMKLNGFVLDS